MPAALYQPTPEPEFPTAVDIGYRPALEALRDIVRRRIEAGCSARDLGPLVSVAAHIDKALIAADEEDSRA